MPKMDRYTIGEKVFSLLIELLVGILQAQYLTQEQKIEKLKANSSELDNIKILVRLTRSLEIIDEKQYINLENKLQEIGRMLGGWIKWLNKS